MPGDTGIVNRLCRLRKSSDPTKSSQCLHLAVSTSQHLMYIALMAYVKHQAISAGIVDSMQSYCQFDCTKVRSEVSAGL